MDLAKGRGVVPESLDSQPASMLLGTGAERMVVTLAAFMKVETVFFELRWLEALH